MGGPGNAARPLGPHTPLPCLCSAWSELQPGTPTRSPSHPVADPGRHTPGEGWGLGPPSPGRRVTGPHCLSVHCPVDPGAPSSPGLFLVTHVCRAWTPSVCLPAPHQPARPPAGSALPGLERRSPGSLRLWPGDGARQGPRVLRTERGPPVRPCPYDLGPC